MDSEHKSGFVALAGRPNVGKSSLLNAFLGERILPVSQKPQTTRVRQLAILTTPSAQVIFVDTPGIHNPHHKLGEFMNGVALRALEDADCILCIFDLGAPPQEGDRAVAQAILNHGGKSPVVIALNKVDLAAPSRLQSLWDAYSDLVPEAEPVAVSATRGENLDMLLSEIVARLPAGPQYYSDSELTDTYERDIAADLIRSAALESLRDEVPHSLAIRIDEYKERNEHGAYIEATLFVERESQKGIVIGKGGKMLRQIGISAREAIEEMSGRKVYLDLRVKVLAGWRNDEDALRRLGYGYR